MSRVDSAARGPLLTHFTGSTPPRPSDDPPTLSERLLNVADGGCACGGRYKPTGAAQIRCDRCDRHQGYGIQPRLLDLIREAAEVVKRHA